MLQCASDQTKRIVYDDAAFEQEYRVVQPWVMLPSRYLAQIRELAPLESVEPNTVVVLVSPRGRRRCL